MSTGDKRTSGRSAVMLMAGVRFGGAPEVHRLRVRDIAAGGVRLTFPGTVEVGSLASVEFPTLGPVTGTVVWVAGGALGIQFHETIDPERARRPVGGDFSAAPAATPAVHLRRI